MTRLPPSTCFYALKRFKRDGYKFIDRRRMNFRKAWPAKIKIKGEVAEYLLNPNVLSAWAGLSLVRRCHELTKLGVKVIPDTLA